MNCVWANQHKLADTLHAILRRPFDRRFALRIIKVSSCNKCPYPVWHADKNKYFCGEGDTINVTGAITRHDIDRRCPLERAQTSVDEERRKTVLAQRPVQQAKRAKPLKCSDGCGAIVDVPGKCLSCSINT